MSRSREWYNQKVRQLLYNLRGHQNATLRQRVLSGEVAPKELVAAEAQQLANESVAAARMRVKEALAEDLEEQVRQYIERRGPNTDQYACPSCKGRSCHVVFGLKGGWISSEKEERRDVRYPF